MKNSLIKKGIVAIAIGFSMVTVSQTFMNVEPVKVEAATIKDKKKPKITMKGKTTYNIEQNKSIKLGKVTAKDNIDGNVTKKISVTVKKGENSYKSIAKKIKNNKPIILSEAGTYTVTYTVKDKAGNKATKKRYIEVNEIKNTLPQEKTTEVPTNNNEQIVTEKKTEIPTNTPTNVVPQPSILPTPKEIIVEQPTTEQKYNNETSSETITTEDNTIEIPIKEEPTTEEKTTEASSTENEDTNNQPTVDLSKYASYKVVEVNGIKYNLVKYFKADLSDFNEEDYSVDFENIYGDIFEDKHDNLLVGVGENSPFNDIEHLGLYLAGKIKVTKDEVDLSNNVFIKEYETDEYVDTGIYFVDDTGILCYTSSIIRIGKSKYENLENMIDFKFFIPHDENGIYTYTYDEDNELIVSPFVKNINEIDGKKLTLKNKTSKY